MQILNAFHQMKFLRVGFPNRLVNPGKSVRRLISGRIPFFISGPRQAGGNLHGMDKIVSRSACRNGWGVTKTPKRRQRRRIWQYT